MRYSSYNYHELYAIREKKMLHGGDVYRNKISYDFSVNGNPLGMPQAVKEALSQAIFHCNRYPDPEQEKLVKALSEKYERKQEETILGNGASELFLAYIHAEQPQKVLLPVPSFAGYVKACQACPCEIIPYHLKKENQFTITQDFLQEMKEEVDCIFLANPNNPVGNCIDKPLLLQILEKAKENHIRVILDECFLEFTDVEKELSMLSCLDNFPQVLLVRAFTKIYGIPGVRLGYGFSTDTFLIKKMKKHLPEWNISLFAQYAGAAALKSDEYVRNTVKEVAKERAFLAEKMKKFGFEVFDARADFIFFYTDMELYQPLLQQEILIRDCQNYDGLTKGYYRIAVKTHEENLILLQAIEKLQQKGC